MGRHNVAAAATITAGMTGIGQSDRLILLFMCNTALDEPSDVLPAHLFFAGNKFLAELLHGPNPTKSQVKKIADRLTTLAKAGLIRRVMNAVPGHSTADWEVLVNLSERERAQAAEEYAQIAEESRRIRGGGRREEPLFDMPEPVVVDVSEPVENRVVDDVPRGTRSPDSGDPHPRILGMASPDSGDGDPLIRGSITGSNSTNSTETESSSQVSTSPAPDTTAGEDDEDDGITRSHWHKQAKRQAEMAGTRSPAKVFA
jgi:hypothetical protein